MVSEGLFEFKETERRSREEASRGSREKIMRRCRSGFIGRIAEGFGKDCRAAYFFWRNIAKNRLRQARSGYSIADSTIFSG
jgi:hypothetical protein